MTAPQQQKLKTKGPLVITANRLSDGKVVYRTADGRWDTALERSAAMDVAEAQAILSVARTDSLQVVDAYAAPVTVNAQGLRTPANLREAIRQNGPTIRQHLQG